MMHTSLTTIAIAALLSISSPAHASAIDRTQARPHALSLQATPVAVGIAPQRPHEPRWSPRHVHLVARQEEEDDSSEGESLTSTSATRSTSETSTAPESTASDSRDDEDDTDITTASEAATAAASDSPLPSPFDTEGLFDYKNSNCPKFMRNLLDDAKFKSCYPVSMMIQSSESFFEAEGDLVSMATVLDAACAANLDDCTKYLSEKANEMDTDEVCAQDIAGNHQRALPFHTGLRIYEMIYKATCLSGDDTDGNYCFAKTVTDPSSTDDAYIYFLPYNITYPDRASPSCNECMKDVMAIFQAASADRSQFVASTYPKAAEQINRLCGDSFLNTTLPVAVENGAWRYETYISLLVALPLLALL